jgi:hypothetical protein
MDNPDTPVILDTRQWMTTNRTKTQYRKLKRMNTTKNPVGNQDVRDGQTVLKNCYVTHIVKFVKSNREK